VLLALSLAGIFGAGIVAVFQSNLKRMFAYSSVGPDRLHHARPVARHHYRRHRRPRPPRNHALIKGAIFMGLRRDRLPPRQDRHRRHRRHRPRHPLTTAAVVLASLGLVGIPGTAGFISKWYLILAAIELGWWWLAMLIVEQPESPSSMSGGWSRQPISARRPRPSPRSARRRRRCSCRPDPRRRDGVVRHRLHGAHRRALPGRPADVLVGGLR
jgi:hypothetical protein